MEKRYIANQFVMKKIHVLFASLALILNSFVKAGEPLSLDKPGGFMVGCNYWASHAGLMMWRDWQPGIVEDDFRQLAEANIKVIRVFPLWPDFQPICQHYSSGGNLREIRFKDRPLPEEGIESTGVSVQALGHFKEMADLAEKYDIRLIVGLVTGWMSGELFVPPALEGRKILSDPVSLMWQIRFVRTFVKQFKDHPAVLAWDLGNECNVMERIDGREAAYLWTASISNAIRAEDKSRLVISGMHGLKSSVSEAWRIQDQGELTDVLTTHPYALFTPYAGLDARNSIRTTMHSAAETRLYADVSGKPCLAEEIGMLGPMEANESVTASFARTALFSLWANDCRGFLWWCAYDQNHLQFPPYEWSAVERDLGLFRTDRSPKPVANELMNFSRFLNKLPFRELPVRNTDAVCILSEGQDQWAVAYASFILSKQAGFDIKFSHVDQKLQESGLYLMPSVNGMSSISRQKWLELLERVKQGAVLYVSGDQGYLSHFVGPAGIDIVSRQARTGKAVVRSLDDKSLQFEISAESRCLIRTESARVLAVENNNNPVFTVNQYGKGKIFFLAVPMESDLSKTAGAFNETSPPYWKIFKTLADEAGIKHEVVRDNPFIGVTEHDLSQTEKIVVAVNYSVLPQEVTLRTDAKWSISEIVYGDRPVGNKFKIAPNDALVIRMTGSQAR